ncbi:MAG: enoyl-CoA hydratase/isomerase family protein [Candidatus Aminicenantes bacterium]|nr:enoyl-CoA hydratase/isomerase family protein [Candidatus Aminicenantes bacterium]
MAAEYETIRVEDEGAVVRFVLHRPDLRNAFNSRMIEDLRGALGDVEKKRGLRVLVLTGAGKAFCAGADLNWMREVIRYSFEQNLDESRAIADFLYRLYSLPVPTIARVNGSAIGGGTGFLSACDIAVASEEAVFGLSEVKIGLVPAAISPYVLRRIGESRAREYFLTGERFGAARAREIGLVNRVAAAEKLDEAVDGMVRLLLGSGPEALAKCKELIQTTPRLSFEEVQEYTARMIAGLRVSAEGQEGMASFLEKRAPRWTEDA